jgi:hypothetical protein
MGGQLGTYPVAQFRPPNQDQGMNVGLCRWVVALVQIRFGLWATQMRQKYNHNLSAHGVEAVPDLDTLRVQPPPAAPRSEGKSFEMY